MVASDEPSGRPGEGGGAEPAAKGRKSAHFHARRRELHAADDAQDMHGHKSAPGRQVSESRRAHLTRRSQQKAADGSGHLSLGARCRHDRHGEGVVVAVTDEGNRKVEFDGGETHVYMPQSQYKLKPVAPKGSTAAATTGSKREGKKAMAAPAQTAPDSGGLCEPSMLPFPQLGGRPSVMEFAEESAASDGLCEASVLPQPRPPMLADPDLRQDPRTEVKI